MLIFSMTAETKVLKTFKVHKQMRILKHATFSEWLKID